MSFTFLFITKGRDGFGKSLLNCLGQIEKFKDINVVIVDGNKDNRVEKFLGDKKFLKNLKVVKQKKGRFVRACLIGIENLNTKYFTFMHDDDYISPNFYKLIQFAIKNDTTVIGNGIVLPKDNMSYEFSDIEDIDKINSQNVLNKYFCSKKINNKFLPANPACSVFKKEVAEFWVLIIKKIIKDKFLSFYLLHKNIGQDLLLYLVAISIQKEIYYTESYSCQFSSHRESMSVNFGSHNLGVGYWLAKKFYTRFIGKNFVHKTSIIEKINLYTRGIIYCYKQGFNKRKFHFHSTKKLIKQIINNKKIEIDNH